MPVDYQIDRAHRLVHSRAHGRLALPEVLAYVERLRADPDFEPEMNQLFDFSGVDELALTREDLRALAAANVFAQGVRRAFIATTDVSFGFARMFEAMIAPAGHELRVFRDLARAGRWLGLDAPDG